MKCYSLERGYKSTYLVEFCWHQSPVRTSSTSTVVEHIEGAQWLCVRVRDRSVSLKQHTPKWFSLETLHVFVYPSAIIVHIFPKQWTIRLSSNHKRVFVCCDFVLILKQQQQIKNNPSAKHRKSTEKKIKIKEQKVSETTKQNWRIENWIEHKFMTAQINNNNIYARRTEDLLNRKPIKLWWTQLECFSNKILFIRQRRSE